eukprot:Hpha_TRINITY_DN16526_c0_g9::TRINITY_DN16526_c0_g9_i1::g.133979::m.133979
MWMNMSKVRALQNQQDIWYKWGKGVPDNHTPSFSKLSLFQHAIILCYSKGCPPPCRAQLWRSNSMHSRTAASGLAACDAADIGVSAGSHGLRGTGVGRGRGGRGVGGWRVGRGVGGKGGISSAIIPAGPTKPDFRRSEPGLSTACRSAANAAAAWSRSPGTGIRSSSSATVVHFSTATHVSVSCVARERRDTGAGGSLRQDPGSPRRPGVMPEESVERARRQTHNTTTEVTTSPPTEDNTAPSTAVGSNSSISTAPMSNCATACSLAGGYTPGAGVGGRAVLATSKGSLTSRRSTQSPLESRQSSQRSSTWNRAPAHAPKKDRFENTADPPDVAERFQPRGVTTCIPLIPPLCPSLQLESPTARTSSQVADNHIHEYSSGAMRSPVASVTTICRSKVTSGRTRRRVRTGEAGSVRRRSSVALTKGCRTGSGQTETLDDGDMEHFPPPFPNLNPAMRWKRIE